MTEIKKKIFLISLGCVKNLVDSENIIGLLSGMNYPIVNDLNDSDVVIINTCGFLQSAAEEAIDVILDSVERKKRGEIEKVVVTGCFVQRYGYKLKREIPEVDGWLGTGELERITELIKSDKNDQTPFYIGRPLFLADHELPRVQTTPFYSAYLKIAEGCYHKCSYCAIPAIRGPLRSRPYDSIVAEAKQMRDRGVKEINLIAQDTTIYGADLKDGTSIEKLLEKLLPIEGIEWIRLLYSHPYEISDSLLWLMNDEEKIAPYLDIPFQHINDKILKQMKRGVNKRQIYDLIGFIRDEIPGIALRTSMMIGFPGEGEKEFEELKEFVRDVKFDRLGVFTYSEEDGTWSAANLKNTIPEHIKRKRADIIMEEQMSISKLLNYNKIGQLIKVIVDDRAGAYYICRSEFDSPEVDDEILVRSQNIRLETGKFYKVRIYAADEYDLYGEV